MEENLTQIESNCGIAPEGTTYADPGNDPNFVFINDPNFEIVTLFDIEGNIINVNSWIECAHYISGGWSGSQIINFQGDRYLFFSILSFAVVVSTFYFFNIKQKHANK